MEELKSLGFPDCLSIVDKEGDLVPELKAPPSPTNSLRAKSPSDMDLAKADAVAPRHDYDRVVSSGLRCWGRCRTGCFSAISG